MSISDPPDTFGDTLRKKRQTMDLSRTMVANLVGASPNSLAKWEKAGTREGQYPPTPKLIRLCQVLELDPRFLFDAELECDWYYDPDKRDVSPSPFSFVSHFSRSAADTISGMSSEQVSKLEADIDDIKQMLLTNAKVQLHLAGEAEHLNRKVDNKNGPDHDDPSRDLKTNPHNAAPTAYDQPNTEDQHE